MKAKIIHHLSQTSGPVSGEHLSQMLGVSRVAVWKHIQQLQAMGYAIEANGKGYRLLEAPDTPFPWAFGDRADHVHYYPELGSTMDKAMELARQGCPGNTIVIADVQTKGRGRLQRSWQSLQGGLYFTMVLRPAIAPADSPLINLAAAVDLAETLYALYGIEVQLKWPNDLQVDGRKIAGILSQMTVEGDCVEFVNLGIGVNVHNDIDDVDQAADALARLTSQTVSRVQILKGFIERLELRMNGDGLRRVVFQWKQRSITLGREVTVQTINTAYHGIAVDIDEGGGLVLEQSDGGRRTILYGDCLHDN